MFDVTPAHAAPHAVHHAAKRYRSLAHEAATLAVEATSSKAARAWREMERAWTQMAKELELQSGTLKAARV